MPSLIPPATGMHTAFLDCRHDWGPGLHEDGFGITATDDVDTPDGFTTWINRITADDHPATPRWITEDGHLLGAITLQHHLNPKTGHIGYGVRPAARGRGLATWALAETLTLAGTLGLDRVLLLCLTANTTSARTIERNGGTLTTDDGHLRHYWITLS
ncbi:GNAT family N-acetyltransferase [Actinoplanes hulinensis]|uniref:GNAT family N-acetyltransferase n=1 Tax=Actinoplanes hulinensis TaxID=1144547 RepID=A0ABS7B408_9ACTN|nr:GNAT family N-acetyltransferase [Actinoplanes hulinensis]MBW6435764.1 GNAT family N-acetyltransferase [Actinoplanes hulinensis]